MGIMAAPEGSIQDLIREVVVTDEALTHYRRTGDPELRVGSDPVWLGLSQHWAAAAERLEDRVTLIGAAVELGDAAAVTAALSYLEIDPYYFRSGYARDRLTRRLSHARLTAADADRARAHVLAVVDGQRHCGTPSLGRLARSVADNALRRALRARLHRTDPAVADAALATIVWVRHPGLSPLDRRVAQELLLIRVARSTTLTPATDRITRWLWSPEWEAELRALVRHHDPHRAAAKQVLMAADRRRERRPGP